jgi:hypothetical protein
LNFIDTTIEQLNDRVKNVIASSGRFGLDQNSKELISSTRAQISELQAQKQNISREFATPAMLDVMRETDNIFQRARIRAADEEQKRFNYFMGIKGPTRSIMNIGNTTYESPQGTDADKVINPFEDPDIF